MSQFSVFSHSVEIEEYKKARECFDRALIIEFKVGYERRSQDYTDLKEDIQKLFNILNKKREWQRYSLKFKVIYFYPKFPENMRSVAL